MSRNFNKWSRPRSRPNSRSRGRNWGNQSYDAPRGLRGKELGLYYRNLQIKKQKNDPTVQKILIYLFIKYFSIVTLLQTFKINVIVFSTNR